MSAPTPPPERSRRPERVVGIFIAITWAAVVFAIFGLISVLFDREPVAQPVGPFYGIAAIVVAMGVVYLGIVLTVPARRPWVGALATAAGVYLATLVVAAIVDLTLALAQATSPFLVVAAALAAVPPVACWAVFHSRSRS